MKPKPQPRDTFRFFQAHVDHTLNPDQKLIQLARKIDWSRFEVTFVDSYSKDMDMGVPAKVIRLSVENRRGTVHCDSSSGPENE